MALAEAAQIDVGDCVIEVWQDKFVLAADLGGVEYDAGQIDGLMAARFKTKAEGGPAILLFTNHMVASFDMRSRATGRDARWQTLTGKCLAT